MKTIKGPAIFLAQFASDTAPFNRLSDIAHWVAAFGYKGVQIPAWDGRLFDLKCAAESRSYCDEIKGVLQSCGLQLTELSTHLRGQLVAVHPAYDEGFDGFATGFCSQESFVSSGLGHRSAPLSRKGFRQLGAQSTRNIFRSISLAVYLSLAEASARLIEMAFDELAKRWKPILDAFDDAGVDLCFELHPAEDLHDGVTFDMFLDRVGGHKRCNILLDRAISSFSNWTTWNSSIFFMRG